MKNKTEVSFGWNLGSLLNFDLITFVKHGLHVYTLKYGLHWYTTYVPVKIWNSNFELTLN